MRVMQDIIGKAPINKESRVMKFNPYDEKCIAAQKIFETEPYHSTYNKKMKGEQ